jgi:hypothetical protein
MCTISTGKRSTLGQAQTHAHSGVGNLDSSGIEEYLEQGDAIHHLLGQRQVDALEHISRLRSLPAVSRASGEEDCQLRRRQGRKQHYGSRHSPTCQAGSRGPHAANHFACSYLAGREGP